MEPLRSVVVVDDQYYVRPILVCDGQPVEAQERRVYLWLDVGERMPDDGPLLTYCRNACRGSGSRKRSTACPMSETSRASASLASCRPAACG